VPSAISLLGNGDLELVQGGGEVPSTELPYRNATTIWPVFCVPATIIDHNHLKRHHSSSRSKCEMTSVRFFLSAFSIFPNRFPQERYDLEIHGRRSNRKYGQCATLLQEFSKSRKE
jgi:hypothetical protein